MSTQIREAYEGITTTQDSYQRGYSNGKNGTASNHAVIPEGDSGKPQANVVLSSVPAC
jgi:hypothetical protein